MNRPSKRPPFMLASATPTHSPVSATSNNVSKPSPCTRTPSDCWSHLPVIIPWAEQLQFRHDQTHMRREQAKYLSLIAASALLHQHQRPRHTETIDGAERTHIEATPEDAALANHLLSDLAGPAPGRPAASDATTTGADRRLRHAAGHGHGQAALPGPLHAARVACYAELGRLPSCGVIWRGWSNWSTC